MIKKLKILTLNLVLIASVFFFSTSNGFAQSEKAIYEKNKSRVSYVPGIKVTRGATKVIVAEHKSFCPAGSVFKYNNGDIHVYDKRSKDGGKTWQQTEHILENSTFQYPGPDGEVLMFRSQNKGEGDSNAGRPEFSLQKTDKKGVFEVDFYRSKDNGLTRKYEPAKVYLPEELYELTGVLCRKIIQIKDGSLLVSMYSRNTNGNSIENQFRSIALRSEDKGKTWHYLSTIAFDGKEDSRGEGFDETSILALDNGKILSFLRSGASYQASLGSSNNNNWDNMMPFSYGIQSPIYLSSSIDGGKNWSIPDPITEFGVWPDAIQLENGITAVSYGRPGNWLMFNNSNVNESWGPIIPYYNGLYPPDCGNYVSIEEVAPNTLLVVYARTNPNDRWQSELVGTYFYVDKVVVKKRS